MKARGVLFAAACAASLGAAIAAGCSKFDGESGEADGGDEDGGREATTSDAADAADAAVPLFCEGRDAAFCWSFDVPPFIQGPFLARRDYGGAGNIEISTNNGLSPPNAMSIRMEPFDAGQPDSGQYTHYVELTVPAGKTEVLCEVDVWVEKVGVLSTSILVFATSSNTNVYPYLSLNPSGPLAKATLAVQGTAKNEPIRNLTPMQWEHVLLAVKLQAGGGIAAGAVGAELPVSFSYVDPSDAGPIEIDTVLLGLLTVPEAQWDVRFDNFVCRY